MNKYIDAEKLKEKIHPHYENAKDYARYAGQTGTSSDCIKWDKAKSIYEFVLYLIDSLQKERSEVDLEKEIEEQINIYYNECEKKLNQMSDDDTDIGFLTLNNFAHHFYESGYTRGYNDAMKEQRKEE